MSEQMGGQKKPRANVEKLAANDGLTQSERFIKAAQELECDDDPVRFAERVRKLVQAPPQPGQKRTKDNRGD